MIQGYIQGLWKHTQTRKGLFASYHWGHLILGLFKFPSQIFKYGGFLKEGVPRMDDLQWNILLKWMIWGTS